MTVSELKKRLDKVSDNAVVVVSGSDHSFQEINYISLQQAIENDGDMYEHHYSDLEDDEQEIEVLLIS